MNENLMFRVYDEEFHEYVKDRENRMELRGFALATITTGNR